MLMLLILSVFTVFLNLRLTLDVCQKSKYYKLIRVLKLLIYFVKITKAFCMIVEEKLKGDSIDGN